jgi:hypothetical protein
MRSLEALTLRAELFSGLQQHTAFRARIAAEIAAARAAPWECGLAPASYDTGGDDEELVEHMPVPRRQRKRSLAKVCEAARRAGADRVIVDGVVIVLAPAAAVPESTVTDLDANEWDAVLEVDHGPH